jgi:hypothetical protein
MRRKFNPVEFEIKFFLDTYPALKSFVEACRATGETVNYFLSFNSQTVSFTAYAYNSPLICTVHHPRK